MLHLLKPFATVAVLGLVLSSCGDTVYLPSTPTPPTPPPIDPTPAPVAPLARLRVTVDDVEGVAALSGMSVVKLDASGSSGTGLRFGLDFGDGSGADEPTATHVYASVAERLVRVVVTDALGRIDTATASVSVRTFNGTYTNSFYNSSAQRYESRRIAINTPTGNTFTGLYTHPEGWTSEFTGQYGPGRSLSLALRDGTIAFSTPQNGGFDRSLSQLTMRVRGGSADGQELLFTRITF